MQRHTSNCAEQSAVFVVLRDVIRAQVAQQTAAASEADQLTLKRLVGEHDSPAIFDESRRREQRHVSVDHHVRHADGRAAVDAQSAVHEHDASVALGGVQEAERLAEMPRYVVLVAVFRLYITHKHAQLVI